MRQPKAALVVLLFLVATAYSTPAVGQTGNGDIDLDELAPGIEGGVSELVDDADGWFGCSVHEDAITYGDGVPGWFVRYEDGELSALEDWADASDERSILAYDNDSSRALVQATCADVTGGLQIGEVDIGGRDVPLRPMLVDGLRELGYIRSIDLNVQHHLADPVTDLANADEFEAPVNGAWVSGRWSQSGVAYSGDVTNDSTAADVRTAIGAEGLAANGSGQTSCVADTGANTDNGTVFGNGTDGSEIRITAAKNFITGASANVSARDFSAVADGNGHGSWVAAAIAANVTNASHDGIAPGSNLLIAKALSDDGTGSTQDIAEAVNWCEDNGADVIAMSLGSPIYSPTLAQEIREALAGNTTLIVVAVGNSRTNPATRYVASPADVPVNGVIGVAAATTPASAADVRTKAMIAYFSNVGPDGARDFSHGVTLGQQPDLAAPGMSVVAPVIDESGFRANESLSGTSMAQPYVTGVVLLGLEANPDLVNDTNATRGWLLNTTTPMEHAGITEAGHGYVNAEAFVDQEPHAETQEEVRNADAIARDRANTDYSGSFWASVASRANAAG